MNSLKVIIVFFNLVPLATCGPTISNALGYWPLVKEHTFNDVSGNNIHGTSQSSNVVLAKGPENIDDTSYQLGADSNSYLNITDSRLDFGLSSSFTWAVYVKNQGAADAPVIEYENGFSLWLYKDATSLFIQTRSGCEMQIACDTTDGEWHFIAASYDKAGKTLTLFCDGATKSRTCPLGALTNSGKVLVGKRPDDSTFDGPGTVLNGYVTCLSVHLTATDAVGVAELQEICKQFSQSCTFINNIDLSLSIPYVSPKGHHGLSLSTNKPCFNPTDYVHICSFLDPVENQRHNVQGTVDIARTSVTCMLPYITTGGRISIDLYVIEQAVFKALNWNQTWNNQTDWSSVAKMSSRAYLTIGNQDEPLVKTTFNSATTTYSLTWSKTYFSIMSGALFAGEDYSRYSSGSENVDIHMLRYDLEESSWELLDVKRDQANSGSAQFQIDTKKLSDEAALSFYTFRISRSVNWTLVAIEIDEFLEVAKQEFLADFPNINDIPPFWNKENTTWTFYFDELCFAGSFLSALNGPCKYASLSQFSGEIDPLASSTLMEAVCTAYLSIHDGQLNGGEELVCPLMTEQARVDSRFLIPKHHLASSAAVFVYSSVAMDAYGNSRIATYAKSSGKTVNSALVKGSGWSQGNIYGYIEDDYLPRYYCCSANSKSANCQAFKILRDEEPCLGYYPPASSTGVGDPHFTTLDGFNYTFNGHGEFWVSRSVSSAQSYRQFSIQGRMGPESDTSCVSWFTAFAIKSSAGSSKVQIQPSATKGRVMDVYVDGIQLDFSHSRMRSQIFPGLVVSVTSASASVVTVALTADISVQVTAYKETLNLAILAGSKHKAKLEGLFGNFDGDKTNDLKDPSGITIPSTSDGPSIHSNFGMKWIVNETDSLFFYPSGQSQADFTNITFEPCYDKAGCPTQDATDLCGTNEACLYDYCFTEDADFANATLQQQLQTEEIQSILDQTFPICRGLDRPSNAIVSYSDSYFVGSVATFECVDGYWLNGSSLLTCQADETWDGSEPECRSLTCPALADPTNGKSTSTNGSYIGSERSFSCNEGFNLTGSNSIICQEDSTWSGVPPICEQVYCSTLTAPDLGSVSQTNGKYGSIATFQCTGDAYYLEGPQVVECLITGLWNDSLTQTCLKPCPSLQMHDTVVKIETTTIGSDNIAKIGAKVTFECLYAGWEMTGNPSTTCQSNSTWSSIAPICLPTCSATKMQHSVMLLILLAFTIYV